MYTRRKQSCLSSASVGLHACCTELATEQNVAMQQYVMKKYLKHLVKLAGF